MKSTNTSASSKAKETKNLTFETALQELEDITAKLEQGKDSLEDSMQLYERGVVLKDFCQTKLKEAEGKWQVLRKNKDGETEAQEIDSSKIPEEEDLHQMQKTMFDA